MNNEMLKYAFKFCFILMLYFALTLRFALFISHLSYFISLIRSTGISFRVFIRELN